MCVSCFTIYFEICKRTKASSRFPRSLQKNPRSSCVSDLHSDELLIREFLSEIKKKLQTIWGLWSNSHIHKSPECKPILFASFVLREKGQRSRKTKNKVPSPAPRLQTKEKKSDVYSDPKIAQFQNHPSRSFSGCTSPVSFQIFRYQNRLGKFRAVPKKVYVPLPKASAFSWRICCKLLKCARGITEDGRL